MSENREESLRKMVNSSGFLFQLGVEHEINKTAGDHGWQVLVREYPWSDPESGSDGFIDLVLRHFSYICRIVVECKRSRDASWVFLVPQKSEKQLLVARCLWTNSATGGQVSSGWHDFTISPKAPEAAFCVIRGTGEGDQGLLERLSGTLLKATESLAAEELQLRSRYTGEGPLIYLPFIVTTAQLEVCRYNPADISLADGTIPNGKFESVPIVCLRKSLTTKLSPGAVPRELKESYQDKERTIFIVQAAELTKVLKQWVIGPGPFGTPPWVLLARTVESQRAG